MKDVIVVQAVIPDYRVGFFESLSLKKKIKLVFGDCYFEESVVTSSNAFSFRNKHISKNEFCFGCNHQLPVWGMFTCIESWHTCTSKRSSP